MPAVVPLGVALERPFHELAQIVHPVGEALVDAPHRHLLVGQPPRRLPPRPGQLRRHSASQRAFRMPGDSPERGGGASGFSD